MERKSNKGLVVGLVICIIAIIGLLVYIGYDKKMFVKTSKTTVNSVKEKEAKTSEEEISDAYVKQDLIKKVNNVMSVGLNNTTNISSVNNGLNTLQIIEKDNLESLSESYKLYVVIASLKNQNRFGEGWDATQAQKDTYTKLLKTLSWDDTSISTQLDKSFYVTSEEVTKEYSNLYSSTYNPQSVESEYCPAYKFDPATNTYYEHGECGGTALPGIATYINKLTEDKNNAYAYVNIGVVDYLADDNGNGKVYTSFARSGNTYDIGSTKIENFIINKDNNKEFQEYKFTFVKNSDGIYTLDTIAKAE